LQEKVTSGRVLAKNADHNKNWTYSSHFDQQRYLGDLCPLQILWTATLANLYEGYKMCTAHTPDEAVL
jgi:hypothetical protein